MVPGYLQRDLGCLLGIFGPVDGYQDFHCFHWVIWNLFKSCEAIVSVTHWLLYKIMIKYEKFKKIRKKEHSEVTRFLKRTTHLTAREWVMARLCADFKNVQGRSEMTWIGAHLPELVPFFRESYSRQEVSTARASFKKKLERSGTTLFYSYYSGLITKDEMLDIIHTVTKNVHILLDLEDTADAIDPAEGVQNMMMEVLLQINTALKE